jgi:phage-related protein
MIEKITKAFTFKATIPEVENVYIPKIQSTFTPPRADFNEIAQGIHEQLKLKYERRED